MGVQAADEVATHRLRLCLATPPRSPLPSSSSDGVRRLVRAVGTWLAIALRAPGGMTVQMHRPVLQHKGPGRPTVRPRACAAPARPHRRCPSALAARLCMGDRMAPLRPRRHEECWDRTVATRQRPSLTATLTGARRSPRRRRRIRRPTRNSTQDRTSRTVLPRTAPRHQRCMAHPLPLPSLRPRHPTSPCATRSHYLLPPWSCSPRRQASPLACPNRRTCHSSTHPRACIACLPRCCTCYACASSCLRCSHMPPPFVECRDAGPPLRIVESPRRPSWAPHRRRRIRGGQCTRGTRTADEGTLSI